MAPFRRYLRITKHSVLEVRIYLDRPADAQAWLLKRDNPALPRIIQAVRPLVLPKLREENERGKSRTAAKAKKKGVKDVVVEDDFEVSIFLTESSSRHSVMTKQKMFKDKRRIQSNSGKLTNWLTTGTSDQPVVINELAADPIVIEEDDDEVINLADIPEAPKRSTRPKRDRSEAKNKASESEEEYLFIPETVTSKRPMTGATSAAAEVIEEEDEAQDDKKKLGLNTSYEGFSIYGRILCLVVKRRGAKNAAGGAATPVSSQQMLENWVSTQAAGQTGNDDVEDNG